MIDQTTVQSGYDVEVLLGSRYLQYLLLLAADVGLIPASVTVSGTTVRLMEPGTTDRTYEQDPDAPQLVPSNVDTPLSVEVVHGHPSGADVKVTVLVEAGGFPNVDLDLYFTLRLDHVPADDGGLGTVSVSTELVDVDGTLVRIVEGFSPPILEPEIISGLAAFVNRSLDLGSTGSGGRVESVAVRKLEADADHDACLGLYLDLRLRGGPQPDVFLPHRGAASDAQNLLASGDDIAFATRADLYGDLGPDARFRRAEPSGSGFSYPIRQHPSDPDSDVVGQLLGITVRPPKTEDSLQPDPSQPRVPGGPQPAPPPAGGGYLTLIVHGDYELDYLPDPDYRLYVYLHSGEDDEGVLTWDSNSQFEAGILADVVFGILSLALIPVLGPWSLLVFTTLELLKEGAERIVAAAVIDERVEKKVDATMLDIAPNRFTVVRRRWDPFFETHHQLGLRPGAVAVNDLGMAMTGPAVLTRAPKVVRGSVIREALRDDADVLTGLAYRVRDVEDYLALADVHAPATERGELMPAGLTIDPSLLALTVEDAVERSSTGRLEQGIDYHVHRVDVDANTVTWLLLISLRERDAISEELVGLQTEQARARVTADEGAALRAEVEAELDQQGIIATPAEVDALVVARIEARVAEEVALYVDGGLATDLQAGLDAVATLVLSPDEAARLQDDGLLFVHDYVPVHVRATDRWYLRDRYVRLEEKTPAARRADNLVSKPRFRRTPAG